MIYDRRAARRYARAFVHEKADKGKIALLVKEISALVRVIESDREIGEFFLSPINPKEVKLKVVGNIIKKLEFSSYTQTLLKLLINKDRIAIISAVAEEIREISDRLNDRVRVSLTTAYEPSVDEIGELSERIGKYFDRKAIVERKIDSSIIGGFVLEGEGKLIDMSIKGQIKKILSKV